ncbi:MAG: VOC family protein [Gammaproteobacteria bacterium]
MLRPPPTRGLRHVALNVTRMAECERFYVELIGMQVEWRPDPDNVYLSSGSDNLALHRAREETAGRTGQRLDHVGFLLRRLEDVDTWYAFLSGHGVSMKSEPHAHRDGARSFYCYDPDGTLVQFIYHPPIAGD